MRWTVGQDIDDEVVWLEDSDNMRTTLCNHVSIMKVSLIGRYALSGGMGLLLAEFEKIGEDKTYWEGYYKGKNVPNRSSWRAIVLMNF